MEKKNKRILSVDALRGFDMFWLVTIYVGRNFFDFNDLAQRFVGGDIAQAVGMI